MNHPRAVAILSAILASMVAFYVASRWRLVGTLAGAALVPLVHTLVSHWSTRGIDRSIAFVRRRPAESQAPPDSDPKVEGSSTTPPPARPTSPKLAWLLTGLTCLAVALGAYSVASRPPSEPVIVRERVIERFVTTKTLGTTASQDGAAPTSVTGTTKSTSIPAPGDDSTALGEGQGATPAPADSPTAGTGIDPIDNPVPGSAPTETELPVGGGSTTTSAPAAGETTR